MSKNKNEDYFANIEPFDASSDILLVVRELVRQSKYKSNTNYFIKKYIKAIKANKLGIKEFLENMEKVEQSSSKSDENVDWFKVSREGLSAYYDHQENINKNRK